MEITAAHFNRWMDDYINNPNKFTRDWEAVGQHLAETRGGGKLTYGEHCIAYLESKSPLSIPEIERNTEGVVALAWSKGE